MYSIREMFEFQTEIKTFRIHSFIAHVAFSSRLRHEECCFFPTNLPFYLAVKNPYNLRSQIGFSQKNAPCVRVIFTWRNDLMTSWYVMAPHAWPFNWIAIRESCPKMHRLDNQNETIAFKTARTGIVCKKANNYDNLHGFFFVNFQHCTSIITCFMQFTRRRGSISNHIYYKIICYRIETRNHLLEHSFQKQNGTKTDINKDTSLQITFALSDKL